MEQPVPIAYKGYLFVWLDFFDCWCILDAHGDKVCEPYWSTTDECRRAIDSGEAFHDELA